MRLLVSPPGANCKTMWPYEGLERSVSFIPILMLLCSSKQVGWTASSGIQGPRFELQLPHPCTLSLGQLPTSLIRYSSCTLYAAGTFILNSPCGNIIRPCTI